MTSVEQPLSPPAGASETLRGVIDELRTKPATASELDELYSDPETLRRLGVAIATAALRASSAKY